MLDPYDVLGVVPTASDDELRAAWRSAVRALHPDTRADDVPPAEADAALRLVNDAWSVLSDPDRRRAYDAGLKVAQVNALVPAAHPLNAMKAAAPVYSAPVYSAELQRRGGDALYRGDGLPGSTGVLPQYEQSGRWIAEPGN